MIATRKALPRRTMLKGLGAALSLPLLEAMVPALTETRLTAAAPPRRFGAMYVPNGMAMEYWTPAAEGAAFELTPILEPLRPHRDRILVVSGLNGPVGGGSHSGASTLFLTGVPGENPQVVEAAESLDQFVAREFGRYTQLASLEVGLDSRDNAGTCDTIYSCALSNTISWRSPTTPLPMENDPRVVFERLFGDGGSTDPAVRRAHLGRERSILDSVMDKIAALQRRVGPADRTKIVEYLEGVRDVERRIQKAEEQSAVALPLVTQPTGIPSTFEEHAKLMVDLQVLAHQCDLTRVTTFMIGREFSGRSYAEIGVPEAHHPLSHHMYDPVKIAALAKVNTYHIALLAYYLDKLGATPDGDGSVLDHMILMYGAGMSDSNAHNHRNLPILLAGGGSGQIKGGRHVKFAGDPSGNLLVTLLDKLGVPREQMGESNGTLDV